MDSYRQLKTQVTALQSEVTRLTAALDAARHGGWDALQMVAERDARIAALETEVANLHQALAELDERQAKRRQRVTQIRDLAAQGYSITKISREVYGYEGGKVYRLIRDVLTPAPESMHAGAVLNSLA